MGIINKIRNFLFPPNITGYFGEVVIKIGVNAESLEDAWEQLIGVAKVLGTKEKEYLSQYPSYILVRLNNAETRIEEMEAPETA